MDMSVSGFSFFGSCVCFLFYCNIKLILLLRIVICSLDGKSFSPPCYAFSNISSSLLIFPFLWNLISVCEVTNRQKIPIRILTRIALNLKVNLGEINIYPLLRLLIQEYVCPLFYLLGSFFILQWNLIAFLKMCSTFFVKFIPR